MSELCFLPAVELAARLRSRELSALEVLDAHLERVERVNPGLNAIVTLVPERARDAARAADRQLARGDPVGLLHGLPVAHKDLQETAGIRTTYGSPLFRDHVPVRDSLVVERLAAAGAITVGKTNTPEFGAGSQTFNTVFGVTRNPYDPSRTAGGSSGGAAAALAAGMVPIADGSDLGGSLRNPASFCNVVGFRPSPGRVPAWPALPAWFTLPVDGPMARTVADAALMLAALAGPDPRSPLSLDQPGAGFAAPLERNVAGTRVGWLTEPGFPIEPEVTAVVDPAAPVFAALGCEVEPVRLDLSELDGVFKVLRAWSFEARLGEMVRKQPDRFKETIRRNVEEGRRLTGPDIGRAEATRTTVYHRVRRLMERYDVIVLPTVQVVPFDADLEYPTEIAGEPMASYIDWMKSCYWFSPLGLPALSVPAGFTASGLPVGLQIVGRARDDRGVLEIGHAFEQATGHWRRRPPLLPNP